LKTSMIWTRFRVTSFSSSASVAEKENIRAHFFPILAATEHKISLCDSFSTLTLWNQRMRSCFPLWKEHFYVRCLRVSDIELSESHTEQKLVLFAITHTTSPSHRHHSLIRKFELTSNCHGQTDYEEPRSHHHAIMSTRCFTCGTVISNRHARYHALMKEFEDYPQPELKVFKELKVKRSCCKTRLRNSIDQEEMLLPFDTRMFEPQPPPYAVPNVKAQAEEIEAYIAAQEARRHNKRKRTSNARKQDASQTEEQAAFAEGSAAISAHYVLPPILREQQIVTDVSQQVDASMRIANDEQTAGVGVQ
jgi:DNA-directed RNA polymerase subunit N (RpoN/RPB10)